MPSLTPNAPESGQESEAAFARGLRLHQSGDLEAATTVYNTILARDPQHADSLHLLGTALAQTGELTQGIEALRAALEISPNEPTFRLNYAEAQFCLGYEALADGALADAHVSFSEAVGSNRARFAGRAVGGDQVRPARSVPLERLRGRLPADTVH